MPVASMPFQRVDVFSVSGGAGKTLLAVRLAQLQAAHANAPVLLVDADITGPCLGDVLESWASPPWDTTDNLIHLICGRPEYLPEKLRRGKLPVYLVRDERPAEVSQRRPRIVADAIGGGPAVLLCPSHPHSTNPKVEPAVLHALLGHESAGGWIGYVIQQVVRETYHLMHGGLAGVIVDHGPGMGALQMATLKECAEGQGQRDPEVERRAILVTTLGAADLATARDLFGRLVASPLERSAGPQRAPDLSERIVWIVNGVPSGVTDWKATITGRYPTIGDWVERALPVRVDRASAEGQAEAELHASREAALDADLERVRAQIFG